MKLKNRDLLVNNFWLFMTFSILNIGGWNFWTSLTRTTLLNLTLTWSNGWCIYMNIKKSLLRDVFWLKWKCVFRLWIFPAPGCKYASLVPSFQGYERFCLFFYTLNKLRHSQGGFPTINYWSFFLVSDTFSVHKVVTCRALKRSLFI